MKQLLLGAAVAAALPSLAFASCPSAADFAAHGLVAVYEDGTRSTFLLGPDGLVTERIVFDETDDYVSVMTYSGGLHLTGTSAEDGGAAVPDEAWTLDYGAPAASLPRAVPGATIELTATETSAGAPSSTVKKRITLGAAEEFDIGGCAYSAILGEREQRRDGETTRERFVHLTEFGISLVVGFTNADGTEQSYVPVSLAKVEPETCIVAEDVAANGVTLTVGRQRNSSLTFRRDTEGLIALDISAPYSSEIAASGTTIGGVLPLMLSDVRNPDERLETRYQLEAASIAFAPGVAIETAFNSEEVRSGERRSEAGTIMAAVGSARPVMIGTCEYRIAKMLIITDDGGFSSQIREAVWFVDLGFGALVEPEDFEEFRKLAPAQG